MERVDKETRRRCYFQQVHGTLVTGTRRLTCMDNDTWKDYIKADLFIYCVHSRANLLKIDTRNLFYKTFRKTL